MTGITIKYDRSQNLGDMTKIIFRADFSHKLNLRISRTL